MRAMVLERAGASTLVERERREPEPAPAEVLVRVRACAVCRTDLHVVDGELPEPKLPLVPGHQIVGVVERAGAAVEALAPGRRVGIAWLAGTCGGCRHCASGRENLCERALFTGYQKDGGYAELALADARFVFELPEDLADEQAAPLLCAGAIGWRALKLAGRGERLGLYGFGAAAHILCQVARFEGQRVFAFTRPGDDAARDFALALGASWAGSSDERPPEALDCAIVFAPVGALVPKALAAVAPGGTVVCGGIHMSDIPSFPYELLWKERTLRSVANLTRADARELLALAPRVPLRTELTRYALSDANRALDDLRHGRFSGAAVLVP